MTVWEEIVRDYSPAIWKTVYHLEINPNSVGALLHRARESLRQTLSYLVAPEV